MTSIRFPNVRLLGRVGLPCALLALGAALLAVPATSSAVTVQTARFTVDYTLENPFTGVSVLSDSVRWADVATGIISSVGSPLPGTYAANFSFSPRHGFSISGYTIAYSLQFAAGTWTVTGNEDADLGPIGTVISGNGRFERAYDLSPYGATESFAVPGEYPGMSQYFESRTIVDTIVGSTFPTWVSGTAITEGYWEFCVGPGCEALVVLPADLALASITITPTLVAVPEPSMYIYLMAGLLFIVVARVRPVNV
ncbi:hypothetical protein GEOBC_00552 [Geobacteraceae bacterium]|nr:hypothetical protein GEOBC_00552 [Geobacteraceae bacterium]